MSHATLDWLRARGYDSIVAVPGASVSREEFVIFEAARIKEFVVVNSDITSSASRGGEAAKTSDDFLTSYLTTKFPGYALAVAHSRVTASAREP